MGSRTNFGILVSCNGDLNNTVIIMPSMSWKYFYPSQVKDAIKGKNDIDFKEIFTDASGWEGDSPEIINQEYLPTVVILSDSDNYDGHVINYITEGQSVYFRVFTFDQYKNVNISALEDILIDERAKDISFSHLKVHINLIRDILPFNPSNY